MDLDNILMAFVPSAVVGAVAYLLINKFLQAESKRHILEIKKESLNVTIPVRLQAFERIILLLERIDAVQVVKRSIKPGMTSGELRQKAVAEIQNEFNHNVTQQVYISAASWEKVKKAKDDAIKLIGVTGTQVGDHVDAVAFSRKILGVNEELEINNNEAIEFVKQEVRKLF
ncbi:MAG: hypothetical protein CMP61_07055 [Flavobacteriales bacterium]|nr:hypothetical protein [Flavobacteriales bacterium]